MAKNTPKSIKSRAMKPQEANSRRKTKKQTCIDMLMRPKGTSLAELKKATGWQPHSVRGFLSGTVKKMPGVALVTRIDDGGGRRYRIETQKTS
ncbi:MAG: DUF3489 domain-containing protein [Proteobacteria bacterium]|nr:DUF3489 domain-containing protein [Pseudomonadota bacterium]